MQCTCVHVVNHVVHMLSRTIVPIYIVWMSGAAIRYAMQCVWLADKNWPPSLELAIVTEVAQLQAANAARN